MSRWLMLSALALSLALPACCRQTSSDDEAAPIAVPTAEQPTPVAPTPTPAATAAGAVRVGTPVMAPWSRAGTMYGGTVREIYGKLGYVKFNDGDAGWALLARMRPAGTPQPDPTGDTCSFSIGDNVRAPWSSNKAMYSGKVTEVYGKLARVDFLDGDQGWADCSEMKAR